MRILVHDFGGYGFPFQLSDALSRQGHQVIHMYCASHQTTPLGFHQKNESASNNLTVLPVELKEPLDKFNFLKRWKQENTYGSLAAKQLKQIAPDVVISANAPLDSQARLMRASRQLDIPFIVWLQDLIGVATHEILKQKIPIAGRLIGSYYLRLEKQLLRKSAAIVTISEDFTSILESWGINPGKVFHQPNWAPIDWLPPQQKHNDWAKKQGFADAFCFMYTGTLGMKHNPDLLLKLAHSFANQEEEVKVVVVSQGMGASWLEDQKKAHGLKNLYILPYQPAEILPEVLASADVLVALLTERAGKYSVPSKVLTYLCAERPLLLAVPSQNPAARLVETIEAGLLSDPANSDQFIEAAHALYNQKETQKRLAQNGRKYAEKAFSIDTISHHLLKILSRHLDTKG